MEPQARHEDAVELHFSVLDTGIGIPSDKQALVFEAFTQADGSTTRKFGGTGLGLAISSRLVELMGGRIWVESPINPEGPGGPGSIFHFTAVFPLGAQAGEVHDSQALAALSGRRVLIVDDNATNRRVLEEMVRHWGLTALAVESGSEALAVLKQASEPFCLGLLDVNMPGMDGFQLAQEIRRTEEGDPMTLLMLGSSSQAGDAAKLASGSISGYLLKPVRQGELRMAIQKFLIHRPRMLREVLRPDAGPVSSEEAPQDSDSRGCILLAEDNKVNRRLAQTLLAKRGYRVVAAENGREAVDAYRRQSFDVILMDVQMPEMDGMEATATIRALERESGRHVPIVAMTAHAMKGDRERCMAAGMDDYVSKPMKPQELFRVIDHLFGSKSTPSNKREQSLQLDV